jgi:hypothetical protein
MDIYCTRCGEPWDLDTFHDVADEMGTTWEAAVADFRRRGCVAAGADVKWCQPEDTLRGAATAALVDLLGDDVDGVAAMLEDFDAFGLL